MYIKKIIYSFVIFISFISAASAADFVKIEGSEHAVKFNDAVYLKAVIDNSKLPKELNIQTLRYKWSIFPHRNIVPLNAKEIFFISGDKQEKYTVILDVIGVLETKKPFKVFNPENTEVSGAVIVPDGEEAPVEEITVKTGILVVDPILYEISVGY